MDLINLIEIANSKFSAEYSIGKVSGISNHLPMCLYALKSLGASPDRLQSFYDWYTPRLEERKPGRGSISLQNWESFLGVHDYNQEFHVFFLSEIRTRGLKATLEFYLPKLFKGVCGAAFHPLIRLGIALELNCENEIAEALASWGMGYLSLVEYEQRGAVLSAADTISKISEVKNFKAVDDSATGIFNRMENVSKNEAFSDFMKNYQISDSSVKTTLSDFSDVSLKIFLSVPNFVTLHLITSSHALRTLSKYYSLKSSDFGNFWAAWCAAYITLNVPAVNLQDQYAESSLDWSELRRRAIRAENDHLNKLTYTCLEESKIYPERPYQKAAQVYAELIQA